MKPCQAGVPFLLEPKRFKRRPNSLASYLICSSLKQWPARLELFRELTLIHPLFPVVEASAAFDEGQINAPGWAVTMLSDVDFG